MVKKRLKFDFRYKTLTKKQKAVVLPVMVVVGAAAVVAAIWTIVILPNANDASRNGSAANGFSAFIEKKTDLGAGKLVTKDDVTKALGNKAKGVINTDVSSVFNYDGDRSQTVTYNFVRTDGQPASLYIDMTVFKSVVSKENENILAGTLPAHAIGGHPAYYMPAQTLGSQREYRVLVVNGLKAYKFVIDQPVDNVTISEVSAAASLVTLAQGAHL